MLINEQILYAIKGALNGDYDVNTFCDVFIELLYHTDSRKELSDYEFYCLNKLGEVAARYSPLQSDREKYPGTYFNEEDVLKAVKHCLSALDKNK